MGIKKVKIVATLGPSSVDHIEKLAEAGVNVFRINFSHASRDWAIDAIEKIRKVEVKIKRPLAIMGDLAGPKIRIGDVIEGTVIESGDKIEIVEKEVLGDRHRISVNYPSIVSQLEIGAEIYIDDGKIMLEVIQKTNDGVIAKVLVGNKLMPRKGFYGQGISLAVRGLSEKDRDDLNTCIKYQADAVAISFVQSEKDIIFVKKLLPENSPIKIVAKIETYKGLENIEKIIDESDVILIARGDMGLAVPIEEVPHLQKKLIQMCLKKAKPVITATQMLESMIESPIPTRAEVTDVANAIMDGTDAVMLSAETANGNFPVETVKMMARIIRRAVAHVPIFDHQEEKTIDDAISQSAGYIADHIKSKLIIAFTQTGMTAKRISRYRHQQAIIALSPDIHTVRQLCFTFGVYSAYVKIETGFDKMIRQARAVAKNNQIVPLTENDPFLIIAGMPFNRQGSTNLVYVEKA